MALVVPGVRHAKHKFPDMMRMMLNVMWDRWTKK